MLINRQLTGRPGRRSRRPLIAAGLGVAGLVLASAAPAAASVPRGYAADRADLAATSYYAYAGGQATSPAACPKTTTVTGECTLTQALALVPAGSSVLLETSGNAGTYFGDFTVATSGTAAASPVTIQPGTGVTGPVLDGDFSGAVKCPTSSCKSAVLTVAAGVFATVKAVTITDGNDTAGDNGGGVDDDGTLTLSGATVSHTQAADGGGAFVGSGASLKVTGSTFSSDTARSYGGGIDNGDPGTGTLTVSGSTFSGDTATYHGGAILNGGGAGTGTATVTTSTFSNDTAQHGGGIDNGDGGTGTLTVSDSTFAGDSGTLRGGAIENANGAAGTVTVSESTFSADTSPHGAALDSGATKGTASATVLNATIDGSLGGPAIDQAAGPVQVAGTIVADSVGANCAGAITDAGYNLEDDTAASCGFSSRQNDLVGVSPDLTPLASNGGPTQTMAPAPTSPVLAQLPNPATAYLNAATTTRRLCPATDQAADPATDEAYGCAIGAVSPASDVPVVTSLGSLFGPSAGGNTVTITGGNFAAGATVSFGTAAATNVTVVSATQITATAPAYAGLDDRGPVAVSVSNPGGASSPARVGDLYDYYSADWSAYMTGPLHTSYNPGATAINNGTIARLSPLWQWNPPASPNTGTLADFASPIVANGVIYVGLADGEFYAVSEATQQVLWSQFLGFYTSTTCGGTEGIVSTATVADDPSTGQPTVYVNAPNGYLYAMNAATGDVVWRSVVGIPSTTQNDYYAWGSPAVANGKVYVGVSSRCSTPDVPGGAIGFDQISGDQIGRWFDQPGDITGGSVWSSLAVLPDGNVAIATGNGNNAKPQVPYAESVAILNGSNLDFVDGWSLPAAQAIYDSDFGSSPTVFTAYPAGVATTMVGACDKNGYYYAFRSTDLHDGYLWRTMIGAPAGDAPAGGGECDSSAIWNGHQLLIGGDGTTIGGTAYQGSVQALNPTTGAFVWQTGLPGNVIGTPTEDGGGIIAAPIYQSASGNTGVYLLSASTGAILDFIPTSAGGVFAQPVWDGSDLLVGALDSTVPLTAYAITKAGQTTPITVGNGTVQPGSTDTITITATGGLASPANVIVSGGSVEVTGVTINSPTSATVTVVVSGTAAAGALNVTLTEPNTLKSWACTSCLTVG
jgi:outer membrane protein assembly factor BamB